MAWGRVALFLAATQANEQLDDVAHTFGYRPPDDDAADSSHRQAQGDSGSQGVSTERTVTRDASSARISRKALFWKITHITDLEAPNKSEPAFLGDPDRAQQPELSEGTWLFEPPEPCIDLSRLTPLLFNTLGKEKQTKRLHTRRLVKHISRGKPMQVLPRYKKRRWPSALTVVLDKNAEQFPYWTDFDALVKQLRQLLGDDNVKTLVLDESVANTWADVSANSAVLLLSDMREHGSGSRWWYLCEGLKHLKRERCRLLTLSTSDRSSSDKALCRLGRPQSLFNPAGRHVSASGFRLPIDPMSVQQALVMLSALPVVDPGLFRKLNHCFRWGGDELDGVIWNHPHVEADTLGLSVKMSHVDHYQQLFTETVSRHQQQILRAIVEQHHKGAYTGLKGAEATLHSGLTGEDDDVSIDYYQTLLARYHHQTHAANRDSVREQLKSLIELSPKLAWQGNSKLRTLLHHMFAIAYQDEIRRGEWPDLPAGADTRLMTFVQDDTYQPTLLSYRLCQSTLNGDYEVEVLGEQSSAIPAVQGEVLRFVSPDSQPPTLYTSHLQVQRTVKQTMRLSLPAGDELTVTTAQTHWQLSRTHRPDIAANMGQDADGLFMDTRLNDPLSRVYWHPAHSDEQGNTQRGIWYPQRLQSGAGSDVGVVRRDEYGAYRDINLFSVVQRFRWMEPGRFTMGSPEDEAGRYDDEDLHEVTLTQGFWLADTTVTQALWQAVMHKKPSRFQGDQLPVEKVSWRDAKDFIDALNQQDADLQMRLPSEAEWEYACRAGTSKPFYFGKNITPEQVNYNGNGPYNSGEKGRNRGKTVEVKSLPINPWGLYEMHGNVWEWCEDVWQSNLGREAVADPQQVAEPQSDAHRVVRGGSWNYYGRFVRSAMRLHDSPVSRNNFIGFRLALGHIELQAGSRPDNKTDRGERQPPQSGLWSGLREQVSDVLKKMTK